MRILLTSLIVSAFLTAASFRASSSVGLSWANPAENSSGTIPNHRSPDSVFSISRIYVWIAVADFVVIFCCARVLKPGIGPLGASIICSWPNAAIFIPFLR